MRFINKIFVFFYVFCFHSVSEELSFEQLMNLYGEQSDWPLCEELADTFCKSLWSSENRGNFQFSNGEEILNGHRRKNVISNKEFIHLQKVVKSRCRLPADIKTIMGIYCESEDTKEDLISQLDIVLSQVDSIGQDRKSIESWKRSLKNILFHIDNVVNDAAYERFIKENPHISRKLWDDYTFSEKEALKKITYALNTEIMDAVYLNDPDWQRVVRVFEEAKKDILAVIDPMPVYPGLKDFMKKKVRLITLSLPYEIFNFSQVHCNSSSHNAYYNPSLNQVVMCIGRINTILSEGGLYGTIAHEIGHSIDPTKFLLYIFRQTHMYRNVNVLYEYNSSLSCNHWEKVKKEYFILPFGIYQLPEEFAAIDQCLVNRDHLDELSPSTLAYVSHRFSEELMDYHSSKNSFTYLITPEIFKDGMLEENEIYLNPRLLMNSMNNTIQLGPFHKGSFNDIFIFTQDYKCRLSESDISEERAFFEAMEETKKLKTIYYHNYFSILGRNARELIPFHLSEPSHEHFADWISYKAIELKLKREPSVENRRIFVLSSASCYCEPWGLDKMASTQRAVEDSYSKLIHPLNRNRIMGHFTPEVANLLHCKRGEEIIKLDRNCDSLVTD